MIYELVLRNFNCSLEFVFSLLLLQPFNFSPVSFACNFQDWGCVTLREIDFLLNICWSIPCLHPSWKVHTLIEICASLNHRKKTKADGSRLIPRKHTEKLVLLSVRNCHVINCSCTSHASRATLMLRKVCTCVTKAWREREARSEIRSIKIRIMHCLLS